MFASRLLASCMFSFLTLVIMPIKGSWLIPYDHSNQKEVYFNKRLSLLGFVKDENFSFHDCISFGSKHHFI